MFGSWLNGVGTKLKQILLAGASALVWTIWLSRNELVFDKALTKYFMQLAKHEEDKEIIITICQRHEICDIPPLSKDDQS
jgi:hypothetical protein